MALLRNPFLLAPQLAVVMAIALAAGGCMNNRCAGDARTDGILCASQALSSGAYQAKTARMEQSLNDKRGHADSSRSANRQLQSQYATLQRRRQTMETRVSTLAIRLRTLETQLGQHDARLVELRERLARLRGKMHGRNRYAERAGSGGRLHEASLPSGPSGSQVPAWERPLTFEQIRLEEAAAAAIDEDIKILEGAARQS